MELTGKLKEQISSAKDIDEVKGILKDAGMVLSDKELDDVAGGIGIRGPEKWNPKDPGHVGF